MADSKPPERLRPEHLPVDDLKAVLADFPEDVQTIFGPALTVFAGPYAAQTAPDEKARQLQTLILRGGGSD